MIVSACHFMFNFDLAKAWRYASVHGNSPKPLKAEPRAGHGLMHFMRGTLSGFIRLQL